MGPGPSPNGVSNPDELEAAVAGPEPDLAPIDDPAIRSTIERAVKASALEPQFETVITRTTRRLHSDKGDLELALDQGVVRAGAAEDKLCEAELELKTGSGECLLETAAVLFSAEPIRLAAASKAERGYNLILGRKVGGVVPQKAQPVALGGEETCAEALVSFVESAAVQIEVNRPGSGCIWRCGRRRCRTVRIWQRRCASSPMPLSPEAGRRAQGGARTSLRFRPRSATRCARR